MRAAIFPAVAALVLALPVRAQQPAPQSAAMQQCMNTMGGPPPAVLLDHGEALALSAEQVSRLAAIRDATDVSAQMETVRAAHMRAAELLRADAPDLDEYEDALEEATEEMVAAHMAMVRANLEARQVLTAEQRTKLGTLRPMNMMHGDRPMMRGDTTRMRGDTTMMPMRGMPRTGAAGSMQQLHQAMMMHCMMMEPMEH